ncbi:MAG: histidine phosphatase family protein [Pyrinomonadaceae bacterium]|nr:histidine phosphatase family protein [Pyrinomonadaceae bacterium]
MYTKNLWLMRHAKAEDSAETDFERSLTQKGIETAITMSGLLKGLNLAPEVFLSSPANRAKETALNVKTAAEIAAEIIFDTRIYEASAEVLLKVISEIDDSCETLFLVGHNPGFEVLIRDLTSQIETFPTAAIAQIELDIESWEQVDVECGQLKYVFKPKEVIGFRR